MRILLFILSSLVFFHGAAWAGYGAPLWLPEAETAADPDVIEAEGVYYLYPTSTYVDVECWTSTDLFSWTYAGVVWPRKPAGSWNDNNVWAPEVHTDGNLYFLYYAANNFIGVAQAETPAGPFEDVFDHPFVGAGFNGVEGHAIDAHVFRDDDGRCYFYYAGYEPFSVIRVARMSSMTALEEEHHTVVRPGFWNWEMFVTEGPWMVKNQGVYYLMYSGTGANLPYYSVGYATAADPQGPFAEYGGNPILRYDFAAGFYGPGHNSAVTGPDGRLKIVYHTKIDRAIGFDREIRINDLCFNTSGEMYVGYDDCIAFDDDADDEQADDDGAVDDEAQDDDGPHSSGPADRDEAEGCGC